MAKKMLIDAAHPEETRVVVLDGQRVDDFDFEIRNRKQLRGNIYLAKVTRVEPSLQAAFVDYGGNRHGFLAFSEIHPDYYSIPVADREALKAEFEAADAEAAEAGEGEDDEDDGAAEERRRRILTRRYKIQEVIKRRQIMLVQVVKEERGNKGAALTTYMSLAGRYGVLMPNTGRGGGISRKITNSADRKRLKKIAIDLDVPSGMGLIVRTAGAKRTKTEIKRDYEYLIRAWETIRDTTLRSVAPALIYEESSLVKRAIRDLYDKDVDDIHVQGESAYKEAKDFVRMLMPSHAKKVQHWREPTPIFTKHGVERQLETVFHPSVTLRSGGYIVINQTEALVSIDVNSGRATREKNIEQTALKTNMEAAEEAARQMRLRDLAGLVVIDFIDMEEAKNDRTVEKKMKDCLRFDRSRVQMGKISGFGLLELSRQRRRTGILEGSSHVCELCQGSGRIRSVESSALRLMRVIDEESYKRAGREIEVRAPTEIALYVLNEKRIALAEIEESRDVAIRVMAVSGMLGTDFEIVAHGERSDDPEADEDAPQRPRRETRSRSRQPLQAEAVEPDYEEPELTDSEDEDEEAEVTQPRARTGAPESEDDQSRRRRRRGRRGGKRRPEDEAELGGEAPAPARTRTAPDEQPQPDRGERGGRRRRRRRGQGRRMFEVDGGEHLDLIATDPVLFGQPEQDQAPEPDHDGDDNAYAAPDAAEIRFVADPTTLSDHTEAAAPNGPTLAPAFQPTAFAAVPIAADANGSKPGEPEPEPAPPAPVEDNYEPDLARRERFFARLNRWGKPS
jgi:ribonuclease E